MLPAEGAIDHCAAHLNAEAAQSLMISGGHILVEDVDVLIADLSMAEALAVLRVEV